MRQQKGQAIVEYAVVAGTLLLALVVGTLALQQALGVSMGSTLQGLNSPRLTPP